MSWGAEQKPSVNLIPSARNARVSQTFLTILRLNEMI